MKRTQFSLGYLMLAIVLAATVAGIAVQSARWSHRMDAAEKRLAEAERLLNDVAKPRYPNAQVIITKPDGRSQSMALLQTRSDRPDKSERRMMVNWSGPNDWGDAASGGYFWRYIGSEGARDIYEFVVVFGKRLPAEPDERANSAIVRYVSFRNSALNVVSDNGFSIAITP